jgi:hypothetical protein
MKLPVAQVSHAFPAALAGTSVALSLVLLHGGGEPLRPLPVAPVVNGVAGPVGAVLRTRTHVASARRNAPRAAAAQASATIRSAPRIAVPLPVQPARSQRQAPARMVAPPPPGARVSVAVQGPAAAPIFNSVAPAHGRGKVKALGHEHVTVSAPGRSGAVAQGRAKGHEHSPAKPQAPPGAGQDPQPDHGNDRGGHNGHGGGRQ